MGLITTYNSKDRWANNYKSPALIRAEKKSMLQQEAARLVPDENELADILLKRKISPGAMGMYKGALVNELSGYLQEYNRNPFYAFSREGVSKAKAMRRLVTDPKLNDLESAFSKSEKEYETARTKDLLGNVVVEGQKLRVMSNAGPQWIRADDYDPSQHKAMTVEEAYQTDATDAASTDPFAVNMQKLSETSNTIRNAFAGLGQTERENLQNELVSITTKSNKDQINSRKKALFSAAGLSQADWNTLLSQVYTRTLRNGVKITENQAEAEVIGMINNIASGYENSGVGFGVNPLISAANTQASTAKHVVDAKLTGTTEIERAMAGATRPSMFSAILYPNGKPQTVNGRPYQETMIGGALPRLGRESTMYYTEENGVKKPRLNVGSMKAFEIADKSTAYVRNMKTGKLESIQVDDLNNEIQIRPDVKDVSVLEVFVDTRSNRVVTPNSPEYAEADKAGSLRPTIAIGGSARMMGGGRNIFGEQDRYNRLDSQMESLGYGDGKSLSDNEWKDYITNIDPTSADSNPGRAYETDIFYVVPPGSDYGALARGVEDAASYQLKSNAYLGDPTATQQQQEANKQITMRSRFSYSK